MIESIIFVYLFIAFLLIQAIDTHLMPDIKKRVREYCNKHKIMHVHYAKMTTANTWFVLISLYTVGGLFFIPYFFIRSKEHTSSLIYKVFIKEVIRDDY